MIWPGCKLALAGLIIPFGCEFTFYHYVVVNPAQEMFKEFLNESYVKTYGCEMTKGIYTLIWTFQISLLILGGICGAPVASYLSDKFGRKGTLQLSTIPVVIGTILMCVAIEFLSIELLAIGRFIIGFNYGFTQGTIGVFLNEISPTCLRGFLGSSQGLSIAIISLVGMTAGLPELLGTRELIYWLLCLPLFPVAITSIYIWFILETPKHLLLTKQDETAADRAILYYYGPKVDLDEVKKTFRLEKTLSTGPSITIRECMSNGSIRRGFLLGVVITLATRLTGIAVIFFFSTQIFNEAGMTLNGANYSSVLLAAVNLVASAISPPLAIERFGRRPVLLISLTGCLVCLIVFVLFAELHTNYGYNWTPYIAVAALIAHIMIYAAGAGLLRWFLVGELVPQSARSKAQAASVIVRRIVGLLDGLIFYPLYVAIGPYALIVCSFVPTAICVVILYLYLPETRNKDIHTLFEEYQPILAKEPSEVGIF